MPLLYNFKMTVFLFAAAAFLFLLHQLGILDTLPFASFLHNYLDPLLLMPVLLPLVQLERQLLKGNKATLTGAKILQLTVSVSFICEVLFPLFGKATGDIWDVACYFAGSALYKAFKKRPGTPQL